MMKRIAGLVVIFLLCFFSSSQALVINFDDASYGPSETLDINGVSISTFGAPDGQPATVSGYGLGSSMIGPIYSVDRLESYNSSTLLPSLREGLSFSVDGIINSITILPYFSIMDSGETTQLPFEIGFTPIYENAITFIHYLGVDPADQSLLTINLYNDDIFQVHSLDITITSDFGEFLYFRDYLEEHPDPVTFQYGFIVKSLDYTPTYPTPEPSIVLFFVVCLLALIVFKVRRSTC